MLDYRQASQDAVRRVLRESLQELKTLTCSSGTTSWARDCCLIVGRCSSVRCYLVSAEGDCRTQREERHEPAWGATGVGLESFRSAGRHLEVRLQGLHADQTRLLGVELRRSKLANNSTCRRARVTATLSRRFPPARCIGPKLRGSRPFSFTLSAIESGRPKRGTSSRLSAAVLAASGGRFLYSCQE
jgi:hypothetical protein